MKKTLVALAVLAASGASFAQATITGTYAWGYKATHGGATATAVDAAGVGIDTSSLNFAASEDLGGGKSMSVYYGINSTNRSGITGGNSGATLNMGFASLTYSMDEGADFTSRAAGQAGGVSLDGKVTSSLAPATDGVTINVPVTSAISLAFDYGEADQALGTGAQGVGATTAQRQYQYRLAYVAGPLNATVRYATYDSATPATAFANRVRVAASYDLGMVKLGAGYSRAGYTTGSRTDTGVTASVPMGALTLGANWGNRNWDNVGGVTTADGNASLVGVSASYALSKRTSVNASYANYNSAAADVGKSTETVVLLSHSF